MQMRILGAKDKPRFPDNLARPDKPTETIKHRIIHLCQLHWSKNIYLNHESPGAMVMNNKIALLLIVTLIFCFPVHAEWQTLKPMPTPRSEMSAALLNNKIYVPGGLGGTRVFQAYDLLTNVWQTLVPLPQGKHHLMTVRYNNKIYVFGGGNDQWQPTQSAWAYDPKTDRWQTLSAMPEPRYAGAAVELGGFIYIVGGTGPTGKTLRYHPEQDTWQALAPTHQRREHIAAVTISGKIIVIGGRYHHVGELRTTEIYDPKKDEWQMGPVLNKARGGHAAVLHQGIVIVLGGEVIFQGNKKTLSDSEQLDSLSGKWRKSWNLPLALHGMSVISSKQWVYVLGGSEQAGAIENHGRVYRYFEAVDTD